MEAFKKNTAHRQSNKIWFLSTTWWFGNSEIFENRWMWSTA